MYELKLEIALTQEIDKDIQLKISSLLSSLKEKFTIQNKPFELKLKFNQNVQLELHSKDYAATDLLVQLEKQLKEILGKGFKCGIKNWVIQKYYLVQDLEEDPKKPFTVPLVKNIHFRDHQVHLTYEQIPFDWIKEHYIEKTLKLIQNKIKQFNYEGKDEFKEYVWKSKERKITYQGDPAVDLEKKGWIKHTDAKGQWIFGREFTSLINVFKELLIEKIYSPLGFYEMTFPKFEYWDIAKKSGHAKNVYPNAYFVSVPKSASLDIWQEVMDLYEITGEVQSELIKERSNCVGIMSFAQCPPFWPYLKNKVIEPASLPLLVYDWSGPTYRNESGGTHGLDRVEELHRIEMLFVGTKEQVIDYWQKIREAVIKLYDQTLEMEMRVARVTPWWMAHAGIRTDQGTAEVGTFDFDVYLPYRGNREQEWLEVGNVSSNGDKYPLAWNVKDKAQQILWSGCAGSSFERMLVSFLAQKGIDPKNWPKEVRERFEQKIKGVKPLIFY
ncbi:MAG: aminoacyl--tRNA ligase-related protein [Candidatus Woesearchaeota archaeon]|jgi:seryl-tRNA synthetase